MLNISSFSRLSLQRRLAFVVAVSLAGIFASFAYLGNQALSESTDRTLRERLFLAQMAASHYDTLLVHGLEELERTAKLDVFDLYDGDLEPEKRVLREVFSQLVIFSYNVFLTDRDGQVLWTEPYDVRLVGSSLSLQADFARALQAEKPYISNLSYVFYSLSSDKPVVFLTVPVRDRDGQVTGLLGGAIDLSSPLFGEFILPVQMGETGHVQVVDERGMVLGGTLKDGKFRKWHHADMVRDLLSGSRTSSVATFPAVHQGVESGTDVLAFAPLKIAHWGVGVEQEINEAFAPTRNLQVSLLLLAGVTLSVALVVVTTSVRNVIGPVKALTRASMMIAAGDLTTPVKITGPDEIGVLARSFDAMREELYQSRAEIEKWNRELEDRVRQRTRELSAMFEVSQIVASTFDLEVLLSTAIRRIVTILQPADVGAIFLVDPSSNDLVARAIHANKDSLLASSKLRVGESVPAELAESAGGICRSALELASLIEEAKANGVELTEQSNAGTCCGSKAVCIPLASKGQAIGCLLLLAVESNEPFSESDLQISQALADQVAVAIENAYLAEEASMVQALKKADRLKTEFISTVSHELRTPLASIKGYTTTLLRDDANWNPEIQREFLQIVDEESDKLRELIDNLLEISKMEAGFLTIDRQPVLLPRVASKAIADMIPVTTLHSFTLDFPAGFPVVEADPRRVEQVLHNLLENAVKYSPRGGNIGVGGRVEDGFAEVMVSDEGVGMTREEMEKVFDRFYRGDNPLIKRTAGTGLGLAIAKGLIEAQGGRIWVESVMGTGSIFHFSLPLTLSFSEGSEDVSRVEARGNGS